MALSGRRIAITRAAEQAGDLAERLAALGAEPLVFPTIAVAPPDDLAPLDAAARHLGLYAWVVLASANAAEALLGRMDALGVPVGALNTIRVAAVGPATAAPLEARGVRVDLSPAAHTAAGLLAELDAMPGERVLLPQADIARPELADGMLAKGAVVDAIVAYRTVPGPGAAELLAALDAGRLDAVTFASPSAARYLLEGAQAAGMSSDEARGLLARMPLVAIGPTTAAAMRDAGLAVAALAEPHTAAGLVLALEGLFTESYPREAQT
jgi:uroporphyrinogen-III synthase